jgi:TorA maturation chaperone TorD
MTSAQPAIDEEEVARAETYGLLSRLFYAPMDAALHGQLLAIPATAGLDAGPLEAAWAALVDEARGATVSAVAAEYDALFGGVGRPEVLLYASHYLSGFLNDKPLALLRRDLAAWGLERQAGMPESEDHLSYLCQVMRWLIVADAGRPADLATQQRFFSRHLHSWIPGLCDALDSHDAARFYALAGRVLRVFVEVEAEAFGMVDE